MIRINDLGGICPVTPNTIEIIQTLSFVVKLGIHRAASILRRIELQSHQNSLDTDRATSSFVSLVITNAVS